MSLSFPVKPKLRLESRGQRGMGVGVRSGKREREGEKEERMGRRKWERKGVRKDVKSWLWVGPRSVLSGGEPTKRALPCASPAHTLILSDEASETTSPLLCLPWPQATCLRLAVSDGKKNAPLIIAAPASWVILLNSHSCLLNEQMKMKELGS